MYNAIKVIVGMALVALAAAMFVNSPTQPDTAVPTPTTTQATTQATIQTTIQEDSPGFKCYTMGDGNCGTDNPYGKPRMMK